MPRNGSSPLVQVFAARPFLPVTSHCCAWLLVSALLMPQAAWAIYRCETNGAVSYSDTPCLAGGQRLQEPAAPQPGQAEAAQRKLEHDRVELQHLQKERERRQASEESARQRAEAGRQAHLKRCKLLEMKKRWSEEDASSAQIRQQARSRRSAQRKAEQYELECASAR